MGGDLRRRGALAVAVGLVAIAGLAGCASNPPCTTPVSEVQAAQEQARSKERELQQARTDRQRLEAEVREKEARLAALQSEPEELRDRIETLEKGSGR